MAGTPGYMSSWQSILGGTIFDPSTWQSRANNFLSSGSYAKQANASELPTNTLNQPNASVWTGTGNQVPLASTQSITNNQNNNTGSGTNLLSSVPTNYGSNPPPDYTDAAKAAYDAEVASNNSLFDYQSAQLTNQAQGLETDKTNTLNIMDTEMQGLGKQIESSKEQSKKNTDQAIQDQAAQAQQTERHNRNVMRALGILNSTAAGEMLSKPMQEFDKIKAQYVGNLLDRIDSLNDTFTQKTAEHKAQVQSVLDKYQTLANQIQNDLRFNERQRLDALKTANAALSQRMADIKTQQYNWATQVETAKQNFAMEIAKIKAYQDPNFNVANAGIFNYSGTPQQNTQVGLYQGNNTAFDEQKKRLSQT